MSNTYFHIQAVAPHTTAFRPFSVGGIYTIGGQLNPYLSRLKISATRAHPSLPPGETQRSYVFMLRESVFENVRLTCFPHLPSRYMALWMCEDLETARQWHVRLPHQGDRQILEIRLLEGATHTAYEDHITALPENIDELERRADRYWRGVKGRQLSEVLCTGRIEILRAIPV
jgi:hypothetical protein